MNSIFIRTFKKDFCWLEYCFKFINKNWHGSGIDISVCLDDYDFEENIDELETIANKSKIPVSIFEWNRCCYFGYNDQQVCKLYADTYCNGDYIIFVDSDCMLINKGCISDFFVNDKPLLLYDSWSHVGEAICWKERVEWMFEEEVGYEFMRRLPFIIKSSHLTELRILLNNIHKNEIRDVVNKNNKMVSEFNAMGYFVFKTHHEEYEHFFLRERNPPPSPWKQFWSHSDFNKEKIELESLLNQL